VAAVEDLADGRGVVGDLSQVAVGGLDRGRRKATKGWRPRRISPTSRPITSRRPLRHLRVHLLGAACYAERMGRPSIPPSLLAPVLLLQYRTGTSDEQAMECVAWDLR
jgi:hypothetical protein